MQENQLILLHLLIITQLESQRLLRFKITDYRSEIKLPLVEQTLLSLIQIFWLKKSIVWFNSKPLLESELHLRPQQEQKQSILRHLDHKEEQLLQKMRILPED
ncbi:MAG: hypothetical protein EBR82_24820 [Caulobacteraceae bacterium]|nr:hypothetical protein [Caulobacteraceae bacterium]